VDNSLTFATELEAINAESIGWLPLGQGVYLHHGDSQATTDELVIQVVGIPDATMAGMNVLLLT
jgi:hypothetical protein